MDRKLREGDHVSVHMHASQITLIKNAMILYVPCATGDSWGFADLDTCSDVWTTEPITIVKQGPSR